MANDHSLEVTSTVLSRDIDIKVAPRVVNVNLGLAVGRKFPRGDKWPWGQSRLLPVSLTLINLVWEWQSGCAGREPSNSTWNLAYKHGAARLIV